MKNWWYTVRPNVSPEVRKLLQEGRSEDILQAIENERKSKKGVGIYNGITVKRIGCY